jgi:putative tricarboxylic transport membrane protein
MIHQLLYGFSVALEPMHLLILAVGVLVGTLVGILPGIGPVGTMALIIPISYGMDATSLIILMSAIFYGAMYGGSTTSILLNIPGESASVVTMIDGHQMAKNGQAGPALAVSAIGSFVAGTAGVILLMLFSPFITDWALKFGPPEYFGLLVFGLSTVVALTGRSLVKGLLSLVLGLALGSIGIDPVTGYERATGGSLWLTDGIDFAVFAMGVFAIPEILESAVKFLRTTTERISVDRVWISGADLKKSAGAISRGSALGFIIGVLPGAGSTIATFLSYNLERSIARDASQFGKGDIRGVAGPESANNASSSGALIPLLTLGIPGGSTTAMMLGALLIGGVTPGPDMIVKHPDVFWGLVASLYLGNLMLLVINFPLIPLWVKILRVPLHLMIAIVMVLSVVGAYSLKYSPVDLALFAVFGLVGYYMRNRDYPLAPAVLGLVLGDKLEQSLRQSLIISDGDPTILVAHPIGAVLIALSVASLAAPVIFGSVRFVRRLKAEIVQADSDGIMD